MYTQQNIQPYLSDREGQVQLSCWRYFGWRILEQNKLILNDLVSFLIYTRCICVVTVVTSVSWRMMFTYG